MTFRRIPSGRYWSYELDGRRTRSVTTVIRNGIPKPALVDWAARMSAEYAADNIDTISKLERQAAVDLIKGAHRRTTNTAAAKGTNIHAIAQRLTAGLEVDVPEAVAGYVDAYLQWFGDWEPDIIATEAAVANRKWNYAGSLDLLCRLRRDLCVVDIKTGGSGVWPETCLQLSAYRAAEVMLDVDGNEQPMPRTVAGFALWLGDAGEYELLPVESGPDIFKVFLHAAQVADFQDRERADLIALPMGVPT